VGQTRQTLVKRLMQGNLTHDVNQYNDRSGFFDAMQCRVMICSSMRTVGSSVACLRRSTWVLYCISTLPRACIIGDKMGNSVICVRVSGSRSVSPARSGPS